MNTTVLLKAPATPTAPALLLRPWRVDDVAELVESYRDPDLRGQVSVPMESEADGLAWVGAQEGGWAAGVRFCFAVLEEPSGAEPQRLAGSVVLKEVAPGKPSAEVGYWTAARARGRGVAPRALEALTAWAFDTYGTDGLERLELLHQVDNLASCRVAEKCGYAFDRILPSAPPAFPLDGHLHVQGRVVGVRRTPA
ncbi:GNAT family N-acetyltransferase [Streptomyces sp. NBC_01077]|uniref:GNAT family N-acetyltransferase n=1 Tax=Streptomyces sp. NBC_01077 TaxID=2903746 RepID=UPI00386E249B|nr:GNAT family N-acetyltransferase [Streptomyces sp. NBC_01077]